MLDTANIQWQSSVVFSLGIRPKGLRFRSPRTDRVRSCPGKRRVSSGVFLLCSAWMTSQPTSATARTVTVDVGGTVAPTDPVRDSFASSESTELGCRSTHRTANEELRTDRGECSPRSDRVLLHSTWCGVPWWSWERATKLRRSGIPRQRNQRCNCRVSVCDSVPLPTVSIHYRTATSDSQQHTTHKNRRGLRIARCGTWLSSVQWKRGVDRRQWKGERWETT